MWHPCHPTTPLPLSEYSSMPDFDITTEGVEKLLLNNNTSKSIGPDQIPTQILKIAAKEIALILQFIFQQSLNTGDLPLDWRKANITPLYKKAVLLSDPANYWLVFLTSNCCKMQEHITDSQIMHHLTEHNIIAQNQHAFRKARSCETQLILIWPFMTSQRNWIINLILTWLFSTSQRLWCHAPSPPAS